MGAPDEEPVSSWQDSFDPNLMMADIQDLQQASHDAFYLYQRQYQANWDGIARSLDGRRGWGNYYHQKLREIYRFLIDPGLKVLELGCGEGDLLAALDPSQGVGIDFSREMLGRAKDRHPGLQFVQADAHAVALQQKFDVIILSDLLNEVWDVQKVLDQVDRVSHSRTRIIVNYYSRLWEIPLAIFKRLGLAKPTLRQNWLTVEDLQGLLILEDLEIIRHWQELVLPLRIPIVANFANRILGRIWPVHYLGIANFLVARASPSVHNNQKPPSVSVIVPVRNEEGNISALFDRFPQLGGDIEMILVEGHSEDNTYDEIRAQIAHHPHLSCKLLSQKGVGKGDAVRSGFAEASGELLMILDADLSVRPEDLIRFYDAQCSGKAEFANGVRLVYPIEDEAMQYLNFLANKLFSLAYRWLLGQPIKDTLCGTKAIWREDYERIAANRAQFGDFDPFGDFDLLLGAARLNLKFLDVPVRYQRRTYGSTNIRRWEHGWQLLKMLGIAAAHLKFV